MWNILLLSSQLAEAFNFVESGLTLLGATAVEDKLQDDVPETIHALGKAGIKVGNNWHVSNFQQLVVLLIFLCSSSNNHNAH